MRGKLAASRRASKTGPGPKSRFRPKPKPKPRGPKPKVKTSSAARRDTLRGGIQCRAKNALSRPLNIKFKTPNCVNQSEFRKLSGLFHPDRNLECREFAEHAMKMVNTWKPEPGELDRCGGRKSFAVFLEALRLKSGAPDAAGEAKPARGAGTADTRPQAAEQGEPAKRAAEQTPKQYARYARYAEQAARQYAAEPTAEEWAAREQDAVGRWGTMAYDWTDRQKKAWASRNRVKTAEEVAEEVAENAAMYEQLAEENALYEQREQKRQLWHRLRGVVVAARNESNYLQYAQVRAFLINATNGVDWWFGDYELEHFVANLKVDAWRVMYISDEWAHRMWNNLMQVCKVANEEKFSRSGISDAKTQLRKVWASWFRDRANARTDRPKYLISESSDVAFTKAVLDSLPETLTADDFNMLNGLQPKCNLGLALLHQRTRVQRLRILQTFILSFTAKERPAADWFEEQRILLMNSYAHDRVRVQQLVHIGDTGLNKVARQTALDALRASVEKEIAAGCTTFAPLALDCYAPPKNSL